jgi:hypothetical protein
MTRLAAVAVLAGVFVPAANAAAPLAVRATLDQPAVQFGEAVGTHVVVLIDRSRVRPDTVRIVEDPGPLTVLSQSTGTHDAGPGKVAVSADRVVACLSTACVAARGDASPHLPRVLVTATTRDGQTLHARAAWPALQVRGRVAAADLARARPPFRRNTAPPPPTYSVDPSLLHALLIAAAVVFALGAAALVVWELRRRRHRHEAEEDSLERALRLTREAESRSPSDRRRAVGLLARILASRKRPLAEPASNLAWARPAPASDVVAALVGDVERQERE